MRTQGSDAIAQQGETAAGVTRSIDARGMACPGPLMSLIGAIREGQVGDVLSSDEGSKSDIPAWVRKAQHEMIEIVTEDGYARFVIRKTR